MLAVGYRQRKHCIITGFYSLAVALAASKNSFWPPAKIVFLVVSAAQRLQCRFLPLSFPLLSLLPSCLFPLLSMRFWPPVALATDKGDGGGVRKQAPIPPPSPKPQTVSPPQKHLEIPQFFFQRCMISVRWIYFSGYIESQQVFCSLFPFQGEMIMSVGGLGCMLDLLQIVSTVLWHYFRLMHILVFKENMMYPRMYFVMT